LNISFQHIQPTSFEYRKSGGTVWDCSFTLEQGKVYQILASSGSGKTTLVSVLAGIRGDYNGDIKLGEMPISGFKPNDWSRWRSAEASFVYQDLRLFPELTAMNNILLSVTLSGSAIEAQEKTIQERASQLGVAEKLGRSMKYLSYGQMQRMAIIRALSRPYKWLILDEPFSHLDANNAQTAWNLILEDARSKQAGIIITSLDPYSFIQPDQTFVL
jgi:putative ABC transport system ATP-binding protein